MHCNKFYRNFDLITDEIFSVTDAHSLFNELSEKDQCLSFEGFVSALQEISSKLYGATSSKSGLRQMLRHCKMIH